MIQHLECTHVHAYGDFQLKNEWYLHRGEYSASQDLYYPKSWCDWSLHRGGSADSLWGPLLLNGSADVNSKGEVSLKADLDLYYSESC